MAISHSNTRVRGGRPVVSRATGLGSQPVSGGPVAKPGVARCLTCLEKYDVVFIDGLPKFYDHGTKVPHKCPTTGGLTMTRLSAARGDDE